MNYWLVKSEPEKYSWEKFNKDGRTFWDGVRNFAARNNLRAMKEGDLVFFDFDGKQFSHVGVYLQNGYIVHASSIKGVIVVKLRSPSMYKYFSRAGSVTDQTVMSQNNN